MLTITAIIGAFVALAVTAGVAGDIALDRSKRRKFENKPAPYAPRGYRAVR